MLPLLLQQGIVLARRLKKSSLLALAGFLAGCSHAVLDPAGDIARQQRDIVYISTGLMLLIIIPVIILIVLFAWRYRKGGRGTYDPAFDHSTGLELAIWAAPLLIIIALGALTWSSTHLLDPFRPLPTKPGERPLVVQVVSLDWKWLFVYPEEGIATVNELVLPVDRPVRFDITSTNMMNAFYAPTLAGMIYAMPGMRSQLHAVLNREVESEGFSSNYSGRGFSGMRFRFRGVAAGTFDRWVSDAAGGEGALDLASYRALLVPSENVPAQRFARIDPDLFRRILERCVEPGTTCLGDAMRATGHAHPPGEPAP
ncbi:MAG: ubiquinol oxidase subunit II [Steroidobacteraceae bacterium]